MLIDNNKREFNPDKLPKNPKARAAVLATIREIPEPQKMRGGNMFSIEARAVLKLSSRTA